MMIDSCNTMNMTVTSMEQEFKNLRDSYEVLILKIIDEVEPQGVLRTWLFDVFVQGYKVIDMLNIYKCYNVLTHVKVVKVVEQIWFGTYDRKKLGLTVIKRPDSVPSSLMQTYNLEIDYFCKLDLCF